jgi:hypothetical protein
MKRRFAAVFVAAMAALSMFSMTGASAADPAGATVWVAHGIPGVKVDVCVDGAEVRSNFKYGNRFALKDVPEGRYNIKVFVVNKDKECGGTLAIKQRVDLTNGLNATAVAKLIDGTPGLAIFVNDLAVSSDASVTVRHAANAPEVDVWVNGGTAPLVEGLAEGDEAGPVGVGPGVYSSWVSLPGDYAPVIGPDVAMLESGNAYQIIAVGTDADNYRFIVIGQPGITA